MRIGIPCLFGALAVVAASVSGCGPDSPTASSWANPTDGLVVSTDECVESIRVDLFVDATTSMSGFAAGGSTEYLDFLNGLEAAVSSGWTDDSLRYYKFGSVVRPIERSEFRGVRSADFYRESGIYERTNIDAVVDLAEPERVGVVVTDLFQDDGDVNAVVASIEDKVIREGLAVGVLAVPSAFEGRVYDAPGGAYDYASTADPDSRRPFYALLFGRAPCLRRMDEVIRSQPYASDARFLLIGPSIMQGYAVDLEKGERERALSPRTPPGDNHFAFNMRGEAESAAMEATVLLDPLDVAPDIEADRLSLVTFRKPLPAQGDSTSSREFRVRSAAQSGDTLRLGLTYAPTVEPGRYTYLLRVETGDIRGLSPPAWVGGLSSVNPTADQDANRTLNLSAFVGDLLQAASSARAPAVAQFIIDINRL